MAQGDQYKPIQMTLRCDFGQFGIGVVSSLHHNVRRSKSFISNNRPHPYPGGLFLF